MTIEVACHGLSAGGGKDHLKSIRAAESSLAIVLQKSIVRDIIHPNMRYELVFNLIHGRLNDIRKVGDNGGRWRLSL